MSESFFYSSYSTQNGGSIFVQDGSCIQYRVCSIKSTIPDEHTDGCHSFVNTTKENYIIESSVSKCTGCFCCFSHFGGDQLIDSTNISYAKCANNAAYTCYAPSSHRINFTSIFNNTADRYIVMFHKSNNQSVYCCNIINNTDIKDSVFGIVYGDCKSLEISFCVFSSNNGKCLFYSIISTNFSVYKSFFDNPNVEETAYYYINLKTTYYLSLNLHHLSTQKCDDFPLMNLIASHHENTVDSCCMLTLFSFMIFYGCSY